MSGFSAEWLALREPFDARARNPAVLDAVVASLAGHDSVEIVDLACGTGSTLRVLAPRVSARQHWRLVDNDPGLLARATAMPVLAGVTVAAAQFDLNRELEAALDAPIGLATASALLDLVSDTWVERLAIAASARSIPVYAALSYDGRIGIEPAGPLDAAVIAAVNAHQRRDKGFGPALGPAAASAAIARFEVFEFSVVHGAADWVVAPQDAAFQREIFAGWASAAHESGRLPRADCERWLAFRRDEIAAGRSSVRVGHMDFFARPTGTR